MAEPLRAPSALSDLDLLRELDALIEASSGRFLSVLEYARRSLIREMGIRWSLRQGVKLTAVRRLPDAVLIRQAQEAWTALVRGGALNQIADRLPWDAFAKALETAVKPGATGFARSLAASVQRGQEIGKRLLPDVPANVFRFDNLSRRGATFLERHGAELVTRVTDSTRDALRDLLVEGFKTPASRPDLAAKLMEVLRTRHPSGLIGVNPNQARSLAKSIQEWTADDSLSAKQIQLKIDRRFERLLRERSKLIADTESSFAGNQGMLQTWQEAEATGRLSFEGLGGTFRGSVKVRGVTRLVTSLRPPLHPRCLPGSQSVWSPSKVRVISRRDYTGAIVTIETAGGRRLTATPNHPILTAERGWQPIASLRDGNGILCASTNEESPIERIALAPGEQEESVVVEIDATDFHGDVQERHRSATLRAVASLAQPNASFDLACLLPKGGRTYFGTKGPHEHLSPGILELGGDLVIDTVDRVIREEFLGTVYNLETEAGWYFAGGIVTHNCRCGLRTKRIGYDSDGAPIYAIQWVSQMIGACKRCAALNGTLSR